MALSRKYSILILLIFMVAIPSYAFGQKGDVNNDGYLDLRDSILSLQVSAGIQPSLTLNPESDVDGDGKISVKEGIYVLQTVATFRPTVVDVTIDFDHLPDGTPIEDGTVISDAYVQYGVVFRGSGSYSDGETPSGDPIPGAGPDHNVYAYDDPSHAASGDNIVGGRALPPPFAGRGLSFGRISVIAEFTDAVASLCIFGTGDSFLVKAYDQQDQLIGNFYSPDPLPEEGFVLEISPALTGGKQIKWIEFGGLPNLLAYFDDLSYQTD